MTIVDADTVQPTNMNRQLPAMHSTLGKAKAEVLAARYKDINPDIELTVLPVYLKDENIPELLDAGKYDFIVDAIDTISPKCFLIYEAMKRRIKIVSSMGAGAKGRVLYGVLVGVVSMGFRYYGVYETGVCFALLAVNSVSAWIDRTEAKLYHLTHLQADAGKGAAQ